MKLRSFRAAAAVLCVAAAGCGVTTPEIDADGVVRFIDLEGGCWGIVADGVTFEPVNLPESMRVDGLAVNFEAEELEDRASICQIGPIIELLRITTPRA